MHRNSDKADAYVVTAAYPDKSTKTAVLKPDATIKDIFGAFWSKDGLMIAQNTPVSISISPDALTIPPEEDIFGES